MKEGIFTVWRSLEGALGRIDTCEEDGRKDNGYERQLCSSRFEQNTACKAGCLSQLSKE